MAQLNANFGCADKNLVNFLVSSILGSVNANEVNRRIDVAFSNESRTNEAIKLLKANNLTVGKILSTSDEIVESEDILITDYYDTHKSRLKKLAEKYLDIYSIQKVSHLHQLKKAEDRDLFAHALEELAVMTEKEYLASYEEVSNMEKVGVVHYRRNCESCGVSIPHKQALLKMCSYSPSWNFVRGITAATHDYAVKLNLFDRSKEYGGVSNPNDLIAYRYAKNDSIEGFDNKIKNGNTDYWIAFDSIEEYNNFINWINSPYFKKALNAMVNGSDNELRKHSNRTMCLPTLRSYKTPFTKDTLMSQFGLTSEQIEELAN